MSAMDWLPLDAEGRFLQRPTALAGLRVFRRHPRGDTRGFLERLFCHESFAALGLTDGIRQINRTLTRRRGTLRGLHFQHPPHAEGKVVQCLRGRVFDVAVDLRAGSPTFMQWHAEELSADNGIGLFIPPGFAHGLQTLEDDTELLYLHTADYRAEAEGGLSPLEPRLAIGWPLPSEEMSERDRAHPPLPANFAGLLLPPHTKDRPT